MNLKFKKDPKIDLFIETNRGYHIAGEYVEGTVFLKVRKDSQYHHLTLILQGDEYI